MRNIFYFSNVQKNLFKLNTRSKFKNNIDIDNLHYLPDGDIEVAVKEIIFDRDLKIENNISIIYSRNDTRILNNAALMLEDCEINPILINTDEGSKMVCKKLKTIVKIPPILALRSSICTKSPFNNTYDNILCMFLSENIHQVEFKSPTFFPTHKESLSNAEFTIVNLKTGVQPDWDEGSPTCIHLLVRERRMMNKFNIFLESDDKASKLKFDENTNMEFAITLPAISMV